MPFLLHTPENNCCCLLHVYSWRRHCCSVCVMTSHSHFTWENFLIEPFFLWTAKHVGIHSCYFLGMNAPVSGLWNLEKTGGDFINSLTLSPIFSTSNTFILHFSFIVNVIVWSQGNLDKGTFSLPPCRCFQRKKEENSALCPLLWKTGFFSTMLAELML